MAASRSAGIARVRAELERARAALLASALDLDEPAFATRPPAGGWCAAHVFEHLARTERTIAIGARASRGPQDHPARRRGVG